MSIFASILRSVYKLSGAKKAFALPEDALRKEIEKQNRHRGVFTPTDHKAHYETITVGGFPCLIVREHPKPSERAILYFFGGGMVIGPDKGDLPVMRKLCRETGCDVWFPFYPLCMEHCITETYAMVYECYRKMIALYGGGNVSTCGFSSGGALALGIAAHNNAQPEPLPQPRHIVVVSPGEVPWNDAEKARMQALNKRDVAIDYAFMVTVEKLMRHGCENVPVGTGILTMPVYKTMPEADITCLDYSADMMGQAREKADRLHLKNVTFRQGDVGALSYADDTFDIVLSLNGFHAFPDKEAAYREVFRVLRPGGTFCGCFYVMGEHKRTDWFVRHVYEKAGFFTPPYETVSSLKARLDGMYADVDMGNLKSMAWFVCRKAE